MSQEQKLLQAENKNQYEYEPRTKISTSREQKLVRAENKYKTFERRTKISTSELIVAYMRHYLSLGAGVTPVHVHVMAGLSQRIEQGRIQDLGAGGYKCKGVAGHAPTTSCKLPIGPGSWAEPQPLCKF